MSKDKKVVCVSISTGESEKVVLYNFVCEDNEEVLVTPVTDENGLDSLVIEKSVKGN